MKKQIVLSVAISAEMEVKDILSHSKHSPRWLGEVDDWSIKQLLPLGGNRYMVLLENDRWEAPQVEALTLGQLYDKIKDMPRDAKVVAGTRRGVDGDVVIDSNEDRSISGDIVDGGFVLWFSESSRQEGRCKNTIHDLLKSMGKLPQSEYREDEYGDTWAESGDFDNLKVFFHNNPNTSAGDDYPLIEVLQSSHDEVVLVYLTDRE